MGDTLIKLHMAIVLVLTAALSYWAIKYMSIAPVGVDDANILFVYSKHFAMGEGLVYNVGGERVEGFSSMSWMLLTAIGYLFTDFPYPLFLMLNLLLVGGVLGYTVHFIELNFGAPAGRGWLPFSLSGMLVIAWVIANPAYYLWTVASLMETGLWACLLLAISVFVLKVINYGVISPRSVAVLAVLNSLLILTRPEGVAWVLSFCTLLALIARAQGESWSGVFRTAGAVAAVAGLTLGVLVVFRLAYFGYPLPNTYYVKVTPDKFYNLQFGVVYLYQFVKASPLVVPLILAALFSFLRNLYPALRTLFTRATDMSARRLAEFSLAGLILVGIILPVLMGGDIFGAFRFYQPVWPLLILILFYLPLPERWWQIGKPQITLFLSTVLIATLTWTNTIRWPDLEQDRPRIAHLFELSERHMLSGEYLHRLYDDYAGGLPVIAVSAAGGHKIGYSGVVIDTMGLNFTPMAHHDGDKKGTRGHAAFNKDVFWQYPPDLFEPTLCPRNRPPENRYKNPDNWMFEIYRGMMADERFMERYSFVALEVPDIDDRVCTYISDEWLVGIRDAGYGVQPVD